MPTQSHLLPTPGPHVTAGIVLLNFGEPALPDPTEVREYLERIFLANAALDPGEPEDARRRSRELAETRAPSLLEEYRRIGGSPLESQAREQARALEAELAARGIDARVYMGMQFTSPSIGEAVREARADGVDVLVGIPVYPMCGRSTTVAALEALTAAVEREGWRVPRRYLSGWHAHPAYVPLWADAVRACARRADIDLGAAGTRLWFSAHGTPVAYLREGIPYDRYVEECCRSVAAGVGVREYALGYQNHGSRGVPWTRPSNGEVLERLTGEPGLERVMVVPISFMHEQSETLVELDHELRDEVEAAGLEYHRTPVPHDDPRFAAVLADLVLRVISIDPASPPDSMHPCRCRADGRTFCLNGSSPGGGHPTG